MRFSLWSSKTWIREVFRRNGELQNAVSHANSEGDQSAFIKTVTNVYVCYSKAHLLNTPAIVVTLKTRRPREYCFLWLHITISRACSLGVPESDFISHFIYGC